MAVVEARLEAAPVEAKLAEDPALVNTDTCESTEVPKEVPDGDASDDTPESLTSADASGLDSLTSGDDAVSPAESGLTSGEEMVGRRGPREAGIGPGDSRAEEGVLPSRPATRELIREVRDETASGNHTHNDISSGSRYAETKIRSGVARQEERPRVSQYTCRLSSRYNSAHKLVVCAKISVT